MPRRPRGTAAATPQAATPGVLSACTTCLNPAAEATSRVLIPTRVSAAGKGPLAVDPARESVRPASVSPGTVESGVEDEPTALRLEPVLLGEAAQQRIVREPSLEAGGADHLLRAVHRWPRPESGLRAPPVRAARPRLAGRIGRCEQRLSSRPAHRQRPRGTRPAATREEGRGRLSGRRNGSRRRTETTDRRRPRARSATPSPRPCRPRRRRPRPRTRAARTRGRTRVACELLRQARPGWPGASRTWRKTPCPSRLEAPSTGPHSLDRPGVEALVPAAARPQLVDVAEERLDARLVAVQTARRAGREMSRRASPRRAPGTSAAGSARRSPSACAAGGSRRAAPPGAAGSGSGPKTTIRPARSRRGEGSRRRRSPPAARPRSRRRSRRVRGRAADRPGVSSSHVTPGAGHLALVPKRRAASRPEAGSAGREATQTVARQAAVEGGGPWGNHGFPRRYLTEPASSPWAK